MDRHRQPKRALKGPQRVNIGQPAGAIEFDADWGLHPGIDGTDQHPGEQAAEGNRDAGEPVSQGREAVPPIEVEAQENRLDEEGDRLQGKGWAYHAPRKLHEARPEQP